MINQKGIDTLIVDDEPLARNRLKTLCTRLTKVSRIRLASCGREALKIIESDPPDVILLDVDMPDISGIEVAERCQQLGKRPEIIFTTAHSRYAVKAFRLEAADFLLKPVKQTLLCEALDRAEQRIRKASGNEFLENADEAYIWVKNGDGSLQVRCSDIDYVIAEQDYMRLCLNNRSFLIHGTMQSVIELLPENMFIRIHRSTMVRKDFIKEIRRAGRRKYVILKNDMDFTIGGSFEDQIAG